MEDFDAEAMLRDGEVPAPPRKAASVLYSRLDDHMPEAWSDPVAGLSAYSSGTICAANLFQDGHRLIIADEDRKVKVWASRVSQQGIG
jgi:hypothetical protein